MSSSFRNEVRRSRRVFVLTDAACQNLFNVSSVEEQGTLVFRSRSTKIYGAQVIWPQRQAVSISSGTELAMRQRQRSQRPEAGGLQPNLGVSAPAPRENRRAS